MFLLRRALALNHDAAGDVEQVLRVGNLNVERDFMHVADGCAALVTLGSTPSLARDVYNVCSGRGTSLGEILGWITEIAGIRPQIEVEANRVRSADPARIVGSSINLQNETTWSPVRDVREGVEETYSWVRRSGTIDG